MTSIIDKKIDKKSKSYLNNNSKDEEKSLTNTRYLRKKIGLF